MLDRTDANTIIIPIMDKVNPPEIRDGNCPIATPIYKNIAEYEIITIHIF